MPNLIKNTTTDSGLACLVMLARLHGVAASAQQLAHQHGHSGSPFSNTEILLAARQLGLMAKQAKSSIKRLEHNPLPAILQSHDGHFFILAAGDKDKLLIHDPRAERPETLNTEQLEQRWNGQVIFLLPQPLSRKRARGVKKADVYPVIGRECYFPGSCVKVWRGLG